MDAARLALKSELQVTDSIRAILTLAQKEGDPFTQNFLQWFIKEQLEEVSSADELLQIVQRAGDGGLLFVEHFIASKSDEADDPAD